MDNIIEREIHGYNTIEYNEKSIYIIENILDDTLCNEIINIIDTSPLDKITHGHHQNVKCYKTEISELLKKSDELYYAFSSNETEYKNILTKINNKECLYTNDLNGLTIDCIQDISNKMNIKIKIMTKIFEKLNDKLTFNYNSGFLLRKIYGETRLHSDGANSGMNRKTALKYINEKNMDKLNVQFIRNSSCIFSLNDDFSGGIFNFPYHNINIKLKKGSVICFPPFWTHPHEVSDLTDNKYRYTISTWFCEKY